VNLTCKPLAQLAQLLCKPAVVSERSLRPRENAFAFGRKSDKSLAAFHYEYAEALLELLYAGRQCQLCDVARRGGSSELALARARLRIRDSERSCAAAPSATRYRAHTE